MTAAAAPPQGSICGCCRHTQIVYACEPVRHDLGNLGPQGAIDSDSMVTHNLLSAPQVTCMQLWLSASAVLQYTAAAAVVLNLPLHSTIYFRPCTTFDQCCCTSAQSTHCVEVPSDSPLSTEAMPEKASGTSSSRTICATGAVQAAAQTGRQATT